MLIEQCPVPSSAQLLIEQSAQLTTALMADQQTWWSQTQLLKHTTNHTHSYANTQPITQHSQKHKQSVTEHIQPLSLTHQEFKIRGHSLKWSMRSVKYAEFAGT